MSSRRSDKVQFERNQAILKALLKEHGNKFCSDCKRNAYPRWASWNLGIFICIRCSGIHRSMGTHISRVKSVDLDSWTDEQLQNMVRWGNTKANKYWESGLDPGHQPLDNKMENFIRTKYELKRWVAPGPIPDPDSLSDTERTVSSSKSSSSSSSLPTTTYNTSSSTVKKSSVLKKAPLQTSAPKSLSSEQFKSRGPELVGSITSRPASTPITTTVQSHGSSTIRLKADLSSSSPSLSSTSSLSPATSSSKPSNDLLSLGTSSAPVSRSQSAQGTRSNSGVLSTSTANLRPDLKSSILSLYAAPRPQPPRQQQQQQQKQQQQPVAGIAQANVGFTAGNDLANPFGDLTINGSNTSTPAPAPAKLVDPFASLASSNAWSSTPSTTSLSSSSSLSLSSKPVTTAGFASDDLLNNFEFSGPTLQVEPLVSSSSSLAAATATATATASTLLSASITPPVLATTGSSATNSNHNLNSTAVPKPSRKASEDEIYSNVWG
ncbi:hypothetical protein V1514DRAFT_279519 [Lipomyces japonicus]|uniref:uncharacterized protein n=1 Tax=Lipomyces japonicus TaxID=56871 RepID=UPI0034CF3B8A